MEYRVFCTLYLMLSTYLLGAQSESEIRECAFDVLQPFLAQSFDSKEVVLALPHEPADGPDGRIVESILDALRKTELRDAGLQDFGVERDDTLFARASLSFRGRNTEVRRLVLFEADDRFQLMDHGLDGALKSFAGGERTVGLYKNTQPVEIRAVADTHVLDFVIHASYRGKDGIKSDGPDVNTLLLMRLLDRKSVV